MKLYYNDIRSGMTKIEESYKKIGVGQKEREYSRNILLYQLKQGQGHRNLFNKIIFSVTGIGNKEEINILLYLSLKLGQCCFIKFQENFLLKKTAL